MSLSIPSTETEAEFEYADLVVYDARARGDYTAALAKGKAWYEANKHELPSE